MDWRRNFKGTSIYRFGFTMIPVKPFPEQTCFLLHKFIEKP